MYSWASVRGTILLIAALFSASTLLAPESSSAQLKVHIFIGCLPKGPQTNGKKCYGENNTEGVCNEGKCDLPKLTPEQQKEIDDATKALVNMCTAEPDKCKAHMQSDLCDEACKRKLNDILGMQTPALDPFKPMVPEAPPPAPSSPVPPAPVSFDPDDPNNIPIVLDSRDMPPGSSIGPNGEIIMVTGSKAPRRSYGSGDPLDHSDITTDDQWYIPTNLSRDTSGTGILGDLPPLSPFFNAFSSTFPSQAPFSPSSPNTSNSQPTSNTAGTRNPAAGNNTPTRGNDFNPTSFSDLIKKAMEDVGTQVTGFWDGLFDSDKNLTIAEELPSTGLADISTAFAPEDAKDGSGDPTTSEGALINSPESGGEQPFGVDQPATSDGDRLSDSEGRTEIPPSTNGTLSRIDPITQQSAQNVQNVEKGVVEMQQKLDNIEASLSPTGTDAEALRSTREALQEARNEIRQLREALTENGSRLALQSAVQAQELADATKKLSELTDTTQTRLDMAGSPVDMASIAEKYYNQVKNAADEMERALANSTPPPTQLSRLWEGLQSAWRSLSGFVGKVWNSLIL